MDRLFVLSAKHFMCCSDGVIKTEKKEFFNNHNRIQSAGDYQFFSVDSNGISKHTAGHNNFLQTYLHGI
jgi:hypothetical protein